MLFSNKLQDALKIDDNIYDAIDESATILELFSSHEVRRLSESIKMSLYAPETHTSHIEQNCLALEFRTDVETNFSNKRDSLVAALKAYDMNTLRRNFGVSTSRGEIMNAFADSLTALSTDYQHRDPCNIENMQVTFENDLLVFSLSQIAGDNTFGSMCLAYLASTIAMDNDAVHVFKFIRAETQNYRARSIVQTGTAGNTAGFAPYTDAGVTGKGQVVGVADTGLDESSCYFYDNNAGFIPRTLIDKASKDWTRRKVVQFTYLPEADVTDVKNGHGTHVCGIVAGENLGSESEGSIYNGVAPSAKVCC